MRTMLLLRSVFIAISFLSVLSSNAQADAAVVDSIKIALSKANTPAEKIDLLDDLGKVLMNVNPVESEKYGEQIITLAEETRDRKLMFKAYLSNGTRCTYFSYQQKSYSARAIEYFNKALALAQVNKMDEEIGAAQLHLSSLYLMIPDNNKALSYATQAFSLISTLGNDSLKAVAYYTYGQVYLTRNEKMLALRNYFNALRIAEEINNPQLILTSYLFLSDFYENIEDYDKAIDYMAMAIKKNTSLKGKDAPYQRVMLTNSLGSLFAAKKNYDIAITYYNRSIAMADSLKFSTLKLPAYVSLLNQYLEKNEPLNALQ